MSIRKRLALLALATTLAIAGCADDTGTPVADGTSTDAVEPEQPTGEDSQADVVSDTDASDAEMAESETSATVDQPSTDGDVLSDAVAAADALIEHLSAGEVDTLTYDYGDSAITTSWSNLPACDNQGRAGIRHGDLTNEQKVAVLNVVDSVLSDDGFTNYLQIIAADEELGGGDGDVWDADCYYMAFFGTPSASEPWALQFGGHHYARTVAFADGVTSVTPAFTGVEPRSFTFEGAIVEPLGAKSQAIFAVFDTLDDEQLAQAELGSARTGILLGPGSDSFPTAEGLLLADVSAEAQEAVIAAVREWVQDFEPTVADVIMASFEAELVSTSISWSTSTDIDTQDAYARIDGPSLWIEFINERGVGGTEIHQHSVFRDRSDDYGTAG